MCAERPSGMSHWMGSNTHLQPTPANETRQAAQRDGRAPTPACNINRHARGITPPSTTLVGGHFPHHLCGWQHSGCLGSPDQDGAWWTDILSMAWRGTSCQAHNPRHGRQWREGVAY